MDTSIRSRRDIEALVAVPPLAVLPWIETPAERAGKIKVRRLSLAGAADQRRGRGRDGALFVSPVGCAVGGGLAPLVRLKVNRVERTYSPSR